jgi:serine protease AprX
MQLSGSRLADRRNLRRLSAYPAMKLSRLLSIGLLLLACSTPVGAGLPAGGKLDSELRERALAPRGHSRVIVRLDDGINGDVVIRRAHGAAGRRLASVGAQVADVPDGALDELASQPGVSRVSLDRRIEATLERTGATIGSTYVQQTLGLDGNGVGIAVVDSGVTAWHDDLGANRVVRFADFVGFQAAPYDDYGHGTHVAGILAGSGYDSGGRRRGIAPGATLLVEKVLDGAGQGYISNVIAAIDYAIANKDALHLRIVNLSVAAGVYESYTTDPLTLAARRAVEAGLVVVSAAGNLGKAADGSPQYGGIGAPGNAPWVITVGASSENGTADRSDDTVAPFSSRGPGAIDLQSKPDLVAPGVGIESLAEAGSTLYTTKPLMRLWGTVPTATEPYLSLSGTSMASPVVSGTIALMLEANPTLTPNQVKAVLQFTAESRAGYDELTEGAGFLNARGAVELAQSLAAGGTFDASTTHTDPTPWSGHVIWGNHLLAGRTLIDTAPVWATGALWGTVGVEGTEEGGGSNDLGAATNSNAGRTVGATSASGESDNIVWGTADEVDDVLWTAPPAGPRPRRVTPANGSLR